MTGMHSDPEKLFQLADQVLGEPLQYMTRAHQTLTGGYCDIGTIDFGILPGPIMVGPYNTAKDAFGTAVGQAADLINGMATGLADVAKVYGAAESASDLKAPSVQLSDAGLGSSGGIGNMPAEGITLGVEVLLYATFAAIAGVLDACAALTPAALVAVAAWEVTQPIDNSITGAISGWQSAKLDVNASKDALDDAVNHISDGWADDDSARPAFDSWFRQFDLDLDQLKDGIDQIPDKLQDALQEIHTIHETLFVAAMVALAALIALTCMDWAFGAPEAAKIATGIGLNTGVWVSVVAIISVLVTLTGTMIDMGSKASGFNVTKPGDHTVPNFQDATVQIDWDPIPKP